MRSEVLGLPVDILSRAETLSQIEVWLRKKSSKPKMVVTAYSEFYVTAQKDGDFAAILRKADLVTPDGNSVLAAVKYTKRARGKNLVGKLAEGLKVGVEIVSGRVGEVVTGVWLFEELARMAEKRGWKIFLLGGWENASGRTAQRLLERFPEIKVAYDEGERRVGTERGVDLRVVKKINAFKADILFVAYNPITQEKWIDSHRSQLEVGVAMGVGGTFNEYLDEFQKAPAWMERAGLKWLWRVLQEPRRLGRILRAVVVFPWLVFQRSL